ncbi:MAG: phospholipase D-like domain-containing protein [Candidatus Anammoxibacter sp.]
MLKKTKLISIFFVIISIWFSTQQCYPFSAKNVIPLINDQYFPKVHKALREAKKSIFCVMYMATLRKNDETGLVNILIKDLIKAHKRGVDVKVIFDQNVPFWKKKKRKGYIERRSKDAYGKLLRAGVPVYYDDKNQITHNKVIVIDDYITIVGSTNWTYSAMNKNNEASVLIESSEVAKEFTRRLRLVPRERVRE